MLLHVASRTLTTRHRTHTSQFVHLESDIVVRWVRHWTTWDRTKRNDGWEQKFYVRTYDLLTILVPF